MPRYKTLNKHIIRCNFTSQKLMKELGWLSLSCCSAQPASPWEAMQKAQPRVVEASTEPILNQSPLVQLFYNWWHFAMIAFLLQHCILSPHCEGSSFMLLLGPPLPRAHGLCGAVGLSLIVLPDLCLGLWPSALSYPISLREEWMELII